MTLGIWFTFRLDLEALRYSVAAFRHIFPDAVICIADDSRAPCDPERMANLVRPDHYEVTTWERRYNLNGWAAAKGILQFQADMHDKFGGDGALKLDSDTVIADISWLDRTKALCGFACMRPRYAYGGARWLRADVPSTLLGMPEMRQDTETLGEDRVISFEVLREFSRQDVLIHDCFAATQNDFPFGGCPYIEGGLQAVLAKGRSVVTFGSHKSVRALYDNKIDDEQARQIVAQTMKEYLTAKGMVAPVEP